MLYNKQNNKVSNIKKIVYYKNTFRNNAMRIGVNTRLFLQNKLDGIGWFGVETMKRITRNHPEHEFFFFFDRKPDQEFIFSSNVKPIVLIPQARHPILWYLFFEHSITYALKKYKIDLFLSPDGWISLQTKVPTLTVIHDLNFEHYPNFLAKSHQAYMKYYFHKFAQHATRIATVSEFSKNDIIDTYNISASKIDVVYNGSHINYHPYNDEVKIATQQKYTDGNPYFIFIGTILMRKNLANLFRAFDLFKTTDRKGIKLVIVGSKKWWKGEIEDTYNSMKHKNDVIFMGRVSPEILGQMLSSALALTYISFFEGFGIPILESFYAETPVITSKTTSMPEVAGDAALLVDPLSITEIVAAMNEIANNENLRKELVKKGKIQRNNFSWDLTAEKLWDSMIKTIEQK
ncbi:MAG: glycosyltransferase family 4 protein [Muribaculaceae bacterium]|nr:glycosyltransferase family 4 protein [Muribaculaceae bacterium]